jgi:hypothetical protein
VPGEMGLWVSELDGSTLQDPRQVLPNTVGIGEYGSKGQI